MIRRSILSALAVCLFALPAAAQPTNPPYETREQRQARVWGEIAQLERERAEARAAGDAERMLRVTTELASRYWGLDVTELPLPDPDGVTPRTVRVVFRLRGAGPEGERRFHGLLEGGSNEGLADGQRGAFLYAWREGESRDGPLPAGTATIRRASPGTTEIGVEIAEGVEAVRPRPDDLVEVEVTTPAREHRGVWRQVWELAIRFRTGDERNLAHPGHLQRSDSPELDADLSMAAAEEVRRMAREQRANADAHPQWSSPLAAGRYRGVGLLDAMERTTPDDVTAFLRFVAAFPGKYMGHYWKLPETYATWLLNGSPEAPPGS